MNPFYRRPDISSNGQLVPFVLSKYDIQDIQAIYGPRQGGSSRPTPAPAATPEPTPPVGPTGGACPRFQATVTGMDGATYFFSGNNGWTKANAASGPANSATKFYVDKKFPGVTNGVTVAVTDKRSQLTLLFHGRRVYGYTWASSTGQYSVADGFPKDLQAPITPQGAFQLKEGHLILYQGNDFTIWDAYSNQATSVLSVRDYFGNIPQNDPSFAIGEDQLYFVGANYYTIYDMRNRTLSLKQPLAALIRC